jgi:perosamine synthetase
MNNLKPFDPLFSPKDVNEILKKFKGVLETGSYTMGKYSLLLEEEIKKWHPGILNATLLSSGTSALECVFEHLKEKSVYKVGVQSNTNFATVSSIIRAGLVPVFIDCDYNGQICFNDLQDKYKLHSLDAIAMVHIGGYITNQYVEIIDYCNKNSLYLVEDSAHAHGSSMDGIEIGSKSFAAILSFFPTKVVNGSEGGAILTNNEDLINYAKAWRNQGKIGQIYGNDHHVLGGSNRMPEVNCIVALQSFLRLDDEINERNKISTYLIKEVPQINFFHFEHMKRFSNYKLIARKSGIGGGEVESILKEAGIFCGGAVYRKPCHSQPVFKDYTMGTENLIGTDDFCKEHFCLPIHSNITKSQIDHMVTELRAL